METIILIFLTAVVIKIFLKPKKKKKFDPYKYTNKKQNNYKKNNLYNSVNDNKQIYKSTANIAKHFKISSNEINKIFINLKWIEQSGKWKIATELGISNGAKQKYNAITKQKYIMWNEEIENNYDLVKTIKTFKKTINKEVSKKEKGDKYEAYIANFFRENGYYVWEHGKEKGTKDSSIDLFIKKENYIYFVQCKDWEKWKIDHKEVKATRTDIREYLQKNKDFFNIIKKYEQKILYITSRECLTAGAYKYIEENRDILEYQVIPIKTY